MIIIVLSIRFGDAFTPMMQASWQKMVNNVANVLTHKHC